MDFENFAIENADTVEEYRESLQAVCSDRGLSASRLKKMTQMLVGVDDLPKLDSAEQARRRNVSQRMQEKMTTWLVDNFEANNRRGRTDYEAIGDRRLTSDFLLQLPHPEQDEEFARRAQILRSGTPQEKTDLFFQVLHQQMEGVTREKLMNLSDEEIVEDFDRLRLLQSVMANGKDYLDNPNFQMSPEQRQELLDLEGELAGPLTTIFTKAKLMATPAYAQVPLEQLPYRDSYYLSDREIEIWRSMDLSDQEEAVLKDMKACLNAFNTMGVRGAWVDDISRRELGGFHVSDVTWMDEKGESLGEHLTKPPVDELEEGRAITANFPDGTEKIFAPERKNGILSYAVYSRTAYLDRSTAQALPTLDKGLEKANHWYVNSSREYKNVQATLKKLQKEWRKLGPNPTEYQREMMGRQMEELAAVASAYLDKKIGNRSEDDLNKLEKSRVAAVKAVKDFADRQISSLGILKARIERKENPLERDAFRQAYSEASREKNQEKVADQLRQSEEFQRSDTVVGNKKPKAQTYQRIFKAGEFRNIPCPASVECGDAFGKLKNDLNKSMENLFTAADKKSIPEAEHASLKQDMAKLTVFHLILAERGAHFDGHAGLVEKALKENPNALIESVAKMPQFTHGIGDITPQRIDQFIMKDGARSISRELIKQGMNMAKPPVNPTAAPQTAVQKTVVSPMKKS